MIEHPERYLSAFRKAGADGITVHLETLRDPAATLDEIRTLGAAPALAISPETPVEALLPFLPLCNMVLVMTVHPGFGGQALIPQALAKATVLKEKISQLGLNCLVEADGGIKTLPRSARPVWMWPLQVRPFSVPPTLRLSLQK